MKTSLKKLRGALSHERRERRDRIHKFRISSFDELDQAAQDMKDMRDCYDRLLSAAAATANSVYEFSESLGEMGDCLLEKTALSDDEESGKVLLMLGKLQLQLQKLVDGYRSHIFQTITIPSESLLNELRIVEEMKRRCDEKREVYDDVLKKAREKGMLRGSKGECFSSHQLQIAHDEYDEEANAFVFRMKSLRQGQSRSLLTQAARHHAAQLAFLKRAVKSLEAVDPHVKSVATEQHIDYQFSDLEDDAGESVEDDQDDEDDDSEDSSYQEGSSEVSYDYGQKDMMQDIPASRNLMELDNADVTPPQVVKVDAPKKKLERISSANLLAFQHEAKKSSKSGPLLLDRRFDQAERLAQIRHSPSQKFNSYVLPTPQEMKGPFSGKSDTSLVQVRRTSLSNVTPNLWHSSPLVPSKYENKIASHFSGPIAPNRPSVLKESNANTRSSSRSPPAFSEVLSPRQQDPHFISDSIKKAKRQAFSGPLTGKPWSNNKSFVSASGPIPQTGGGYHQPFSGPLLHNPVARPASNSKLSSRASPTFVSPPKISELHELPRPPPHLARSTNNVVHSGPLVSKSRDPFAMSKTAVPTTTGSALPLPPKIIPRSYSIPSRGQIESTLHAALEAPDNSKMAEDLASPPLIPNSQTTSSVS